MIYRTLEEWIKRNPNHVGMLPIEVCRQIFGTKKLQREWVGLTDDDLDFWGGELGLGELGKGVLRAVDAHLKEKNNG